MEYTAHHVILRGTLTGLPEFSHENHSRKFYRFSLEVERLSGTTDILPVMAAEDVLEAMDLFCGGRIEVEGQLRSFNSRAASGRRLVISVYASALTTSDDAPENLVELTGTICKEPVFRRIICRVSCGDGLRRRYPSCRSARASRSADGSRAGIISRFCRRAMSAARPMRSPLRRRSRVRRRRKLCSADARPPVASARIPL